MRFYVSSSEDEDEILRNVVGEIVETDYLGADESGESSNSSSTDSSTDSSDEDNSEEEKEGVNEKNKQKKVQQEEHVRNKEHEQKKDKLMQKEKEKQQQKEKEKQQQKEKEKQQQKENGKGKKKKKTAEEQTAEEQTVEEQTVEEQTVEEQTVEEEQEYQVGDFVVAVYEGKWLLAQVDIDQDNAGTSHVNLTYMEKVGENQFKWPKHDDLLLTLKEDILFRCTTPMLVGSSIRASHVGLPHSEALRADAALDSVRVSSAKCYCTYLPYWDLRYFLFL
jgi:flagellar biosynthesis GTPase FlhF